MGVLKKIEWFHLLVIGIFVVFGYLLNLAINSDLEVKHAFDLPLTAFGVVCYWLAAQRMQHTKRNMYFYDWKSNWWRKLLGKLGNLAALVLFLGGILLFFVGISMNESPGIDTYLSFIINGVGAVAAYVVFCYLFVWSEYTAKDGTMVVNKNGDVWFPKGKSFKLFPFVRDDKKVVQDTMTLRLINSEINFTDGVFSVNFVIKFTLDLKKAAEYGIQKFYQESFEANVKEVILNSITQKASKLSYGQFVHAKEVAGEIEIDNFPVKWMASSFAIAYLLLFTQT